MSRASFGLILSFLVLITTACGRFQAASNSHLPPTEASPLAAEAEALDIQKELDADNKDPNAAAETAQDNQEFEDDVLEAQPGQKTVSENNLVQQACSEQQLSSGSSVQIKQKIFICALLPVTIRMNKAVWNQRVAVQKYISKEKRNGVFTADEVNWLLRLKASYKLSTEDGYEKVLERVDVVPVALLISQAALESDWGTSRIALASKNLFGREGIAAKNDCFMVGSVCYLKYSDLDHQISDQIEYYNDREFVFMKKFRAKRAALRAAGQPLDSVALAETLKGYAEIKRDDPDAYPRKIRVTLQGALNIQQYQISEEKPSQK